jgi:hypothetical protein
MCGWLPACGVGCGWLASLLIVDVPLAQPADPHDLVVYQ